MSDVLMEKALRGEKLTDVEIIDSHNHLGRWSAFCVHDSGTIEEMVKRADQVGIDKMCITAHSSIGPDYIYGNDMVLDAYKKFPDRVIGYVTINPNYPEDMKHELDRCLSNKDAFRAIKLHPACHMRPVDYYTYDAVYERADQDHLAILIHIWGDGMVDAVDRLASRYPNANFIMGHTGGDQPVMEHGLAVINRHDNVWGDLAISTATDGNVEFFVKEAGSKKILFGTDMPFYDPTFTLARVAMADISMDEKRDILGGNARKLMRL